MDLGHTGTGAASAANPGHVATAIAAAAIVVEANGNKGKSNGKQKASTPSQPMVPENKASEQGNTTLEKQVAALTGKLRDLQEEVLELRKLKEEVSNLKLKVAELEEKQKPKEPGRSPSPTADLRVQQQGGPGHAQ